MNINSLSRSCDRTKEIMAKGARLRLENKKFYKNSTGYGSFLLFLFGLTYDDGTYVKGLSLYWCRFLRIFIPSIYIMRAVVLTRRKLSEYHDLSDVIRFHSVWQIVSCLILYTNFLFKQKMMTKLSKNFKIFMPKTFDDKYLWYIPFLCLFFGQLLIDFFVWSYLKYIDSSFETDNERTLDPLFKYLPREGLIFAVIQNFRVIFFLIHSQSWIFATYLIYIVHVWRFHHVNMFFFDYHVHGIGVRKLRELWQRIQDVRRLDQRLLELLPFLWTVNVFVKSFVNAVGSRINANQKNKETDVLLQYIIMFKDIFMILVVIFLIEWINEKSRKSLSKLKRRVLASGISNPEVELLMQEVSSSVEFIATGWSLFVLNKSFILSFLSGLISFSVLFMQLVSSGK